MNFPKALYTKKNTGVLASPLVEGVYYTVANDEAELKELLSDGAFESIEQCVEPAKKTTKKKTTKKADK